MAKTFKIEVITPEKVVYDDTVQSITAEGTEGSFGVLADHASMIAELQTGILTISDVNNKTVRFALDGGFVEILANNVIVLTDTCTKEGEVDVEKAMAEKASAEKALLKVGSGVEKEKAKAALKRANTLLKLANK
ncbi:MAG: ATP synthase F1 subunit epsilon [Planctomycetes bacterium GWF2_39_10]|nr:MAG: ATP synthase F1 subunit epsilon [Planctomycetes bacterium GWA2_39_15]OHB46253.1 MAG: ATP synthase F1 subunit epsilon [Planctomycetes bacterium GWF2_39_10]OHC00929.1 MAG: ATP synthase F1 subunit epsilon [Planctomycetes bacterium RIFCSPLOWO2_12_FULL_39_13]